MKIIDLSNSPGAHPDGGRSLGDETFCYAVFNTSEDAKNGMAYIADYAGKPLACFETLGSPRVTNICPVLLEGKVHFIITTARESTDEAWLAEHPQAGYVFISEATNLSPKVVLEEPRFSLLSFRVFAKGLLRAKALQSTKTALLGPLGSIYSLYSVQQFSSSAQPHLRGTTT